jgi:hypothetical protein
MLKLDGDDFTQGRSLFLDHVSGIPEPTAKVYVQVRIVDLGSVVYAQLDTGAAWSVLDSEIARTLGILEQDGWPIRLDTRFGRKKGRLVKVPIQLVAEHGETLDVPATFFVSPEWPEGRTFLGYSGLLDSIRIALDPRANHFYFGS